MKILNRFTLKVLLEIESLQGANLRDVDLRDANLWDADLRGVDLRGVNLQGADLRGANFRDVDLRGVDLWGADLRGADLRGANFRDVNLRGVDLWGADLRGADLRGANFRGANLQGVNLQGAKNIPDLISAQLNILPAGSFIGWKKCQGNVIVKLMISHKVRRSNANGRKCRAESVKVLEVFGASEGLSLHDGKTVYRAGQVVTCDSWNEDRWTECSGGIHFYLSRIEAENN